ncbi:MAG: hypothetical protein ACK4NY_13190 [Spirosomataceae bacterium]
MRKSVDQLLHEAFEDDQNVFQNDWIEILPNEIGEEIRGGDRPYQPMIYEAQTKHSRFRPMMFLEKLGL